MNHCKNCSRNADSGEVCRYTGLRKQDVIEYVEEVGVSCVEYEDD